LTLLSSPLVFGEGPSTADAPVRRAPAGASASSTRGEIVVATPITDTETEAVVGVLRLTASLDDANHRARLA